MRIGVDGRDLASGPESGARQARGIARYADSLLRAMIAADSSVQWRVLLAPGSQAPDLPGVTLVRQRGPRRLTRLGAGLVGRPRLDRALGGHLDAVWLPSPAPVAVSAHVPVVLTVHDLSTELRPGDFTAYARAWAALARPRRLARRAAAVMADSEATATDVTERWGLPGERVTLVRPGVWRPQAAGHPAGVPARYLLYVGALEPRKGIDVLMDAYARARAKGLRTELVVAGDGELRSHVRGEGITALGRVDDHHLGGLYSGAVATVLPSLLEGFGFTPLESLAAGTPPVVSDLPPLRETLGHAALFVAPGDPEALAAGLVRIDGDGALRERLTAAGPAALAPLTWERAARTALDVFRRAAS